MTIEARLKHLGIVLPPPNSAAPVGNYVAAVRSGNLLFLSGKGPKHPDGSTIVGKVGIATSASRKPTSTRAMSAWRTWRPCTRNWAASTMCVASSSY